MINGKITEKDIQILISLLSQQQAHCVLEPMTMIQRTKLKFFNWVHNEPPWLANPENTCAKDLISNTMHQNSTTIKLEWAVHNIFFSCFIFKIQILNWIQIKVITVPNQKTENSESFWIYSHEKGNTTTQVTTAKVMIYLCMNPCLNPQTQQTSAGESFTTLRSRKRVSMNIPWTPFCLVTTLR